MAGRIITKRCSACKQIKNFKDFTKNKSSKDGLHNQCKICRKYEAAKRYKKYRDKYLDECKKRNKQRRKDGKMKESDKRLRVKFCQQKKARNAVNNSIRCGRFSAPTNHPCCYCGKTAEQYHHYLGYTREHFFDVQPVCRTCHTFIHRGASLSS